MWHVYILECKNKSLYTGATSDLKRRFKEHVAGKGAQFTRAFGVKKIVYFEACEDRSSALRREAEIKAWTRKRKIELIRTKRKT